MKYELTPEQLDFRNKIFNRKPRPKKEKPPPPPPKVITRNEYMNNCMFWINEYEAGRTDKVDCKKAAFYLRNFCNEILKELNPQTP